MCQQFFLLTNNDNKPISIVWEIEDGREKERERERRERERERERERVSETTAERQL